MHHGRAQLARRARHLLGLGATAQQAGRGAGVTDLPGVAHQRPVLHARRHQRRQVQIHGALLAPEHAVAVVQHEHARIAHRSPSSGSTRSDSTRATASARNGRSSSWAPAAYSARE